MKQYKQYRLGNTRWEWDGDDDYPLFYRQSGKHSNNRFWVSELLEMGATPIDEKEEEVCPGCGETITGTHGCIGKPKKIESLLKDPKSRVGVSDYRMLQSKINEIIDALNGRGE